ncbi:hypothetical protein HLK59_50440 [Streptomyces sp. S3(2020)]|uniref:hypothetical protein n=1 Tax=Streptomyces sp. S3(2020) TaxID=2732044 RepID=UPI00148A0391|nr:hypothetical protein [Streptomyces sp. S3(2020)]NNN38370.1 hypothetical protein [Streptomyces sp. S3(2020)]
MALPEDPAALSTLHAEFCRELAVLRMLSGPRRAALEQGVRRLREGADFGEVLRALDPAVTDPMFVRVAPTPVASPGPPVPGRYLCPTGACQRVEQRFAGEGPPECLLYERVLTFVPDA